MTGSSRSLIALCLSATITVVLPMSIRLAQADGPRVISGLLASCPDRSNCVSSAATDERHRIASLELKVTPDSAWQDLQAVIGATPGARIVTATSDYIRAEFTTGFLRFTDDTEFVLRAEDNEIAVRSASRFGYYDFGVNRDRIEALRAKLRERGAVE